MCSGIRSLGVRNRDGAPLLYATFNLKQIELDTIHADTALRISVEHPNQADYLKRNAEAAKG